eukprot:scaffold120550_cov28-Tisochrysis_lutea.AAC.5
MPVAHRFRRPYRREAARWQQSWQPPRALLSWPPPRSALGSSSIGPPKWRDVRGSPRAWRRLLALEGVAMVAGSVLPPVVGSRSAACAHPTAGNTARCRA